MTLAEIAGNLCDELSDFPNPPWSGPTIYALCLDAIKDARKAALEEAARVADDYAKLREELSTEENDKDYAKRYLVYAKHVRRVAVAIRALKEEMK